MDIKVKGISEAIIRQGLQKAHEARLAILDKMDAVISTSRSEMRQLRAAHHHDQDQPREDPRQSSARRLRDPQDPGGDRNRDQRRGRRHGSDRSSVGRQLAQAVQWIESLTREVEVGGLYLGR